MIDVAQANCDASINRIRCYDAAVPASARLCVLGEFRLETADGRAIDLRSKKARALLAYLALNPRGETRERLAALLWGEMGEDRARANLRQAIADLRAALADRNGEAILGDDERVRLREGALTVDARELVTLAGSNDSAGWERAALLHQGELLADLVLDEAPFAEWRVAEQRTLSAVTCTLLAKLAAAQRRANDAAAAETTLRRLLALDDTSDDARRALAELQTEARRRILAPAARLAKPSIAVLPFEDLAGSGDPWLTDGIAEDVIIALSKFDQLLVIARQSSFAYRERRLDVIELGRALGADYVLTGSLRRADGRLLIAVQLADAVTAATVWAHRYESAAADLFALESEITRVIVATLAARIESDQLARIAKVPTESLEAYDSLLKAKLHHHRYTAEDNQVAETHLDRARALDPNFALAHAWTACVLVQRHHLRPDPSLFPRAREHLARATALEDRESECHRILASVHLWARRFDQAEHHQRLALELNPNDDRILSQMGELLTYLGRPAEALPWIELAMRLNPYLSDTTLLDHARALYHLNRLEEARDALRRVRAPRIAHFVYGAAIAARTGDSQHALQCLTEARRVNPMFTMEGFVQGLPYATDPRITFP